MDFTLILIFHLIVFILLIVSILKYQNILTITLFIIYMLIYGRTVLIGLMVIGMLGRIILVSQWGYTRQVRKFVENDVKYVFSMINLKINGDMYDNHRVIYVVNYPANHFEYLLVGLFRAKLIARKFSQVGILRKFSQLVYNENNYVEVNKQGSNFDRIKDTIDNSPNSIIAYVENQQYREDIYKLTPLRTGMFHISRDLNIPIVPIIIDHLKYSLDGRINNTTFNIYIGPQFLPDQFTSTSHYLNDISKWMADHLSLCKLV